MIRIGIIGCGRILAAHLRGYRLLREAGVDDFRITALCARKPQDALGYVRQDAETPQRRPVSDRPGDPLAIGDEFLEEFQPGTDVQIYTDYQQLIRASEVDAINDFTPHSLHHAIAKSCTENSKDLLTQKPIAVTPQQGKEMVEQFEEANLILGVCENWRFRPLTRHARWAVDSGQIGKIQQLHFHNVGNWWAPRQVVAHTPWRHDRKDGGGITLDIGPHLFHWVRHLGGEVDSVSAMTACYEPTRQRPQSADSVACDADDTMMVHFKTQQGVTGSLNASWAGGSGSSLGRGPLIVGSEGLIDGDELVDTEGNRRLLADVYEHSSSPQRRDKDFPLGLTDGFALLHHDWLQGIRHRRPPEVSGREGWLDLACAFAALESSHTGKQIHMADLLARPTTEYEQAYLR